MSGNRSISRRAPLLAAVVGAASVLLTPSAPAAVAAPACLTGSLAFDHYDAEAGTSKPLRTQVARNANWELWGTTSSGTASRRLATGITSHVDGRFSACYSGALAEAYVVFRSSSTATWRVIKGKYDPTEYSFSSSRRWNVSTSVDLGVVKVPSSMQRAWKVVDTLNLLYWKRANSTSACWTSRQASGSCDTLTYVWRQDSTDGGYWDYGGTNFVILAGNMPDSKHLILHEAGHWWQWQLYGRTFPRVTNCNPHYVELSSSTSCAWTEGFADAVAAYVLGDYRYVHDSGESDSFVNGPDTPAGTTATPSRAAWARPCSTCGRPPAPTAATGTAPSS
ncbi:metalloprotease [Actinokineospora soli]|uniref:Metalloprotease n=1 Tax=Actinokineospora soli TaxID=1048753 RepID=A0ABW2TUR4_9PSEU